MSPKKSHEVQRLSTLLRSLANPGLAFNTGQTAVTVDIGAGQGYLSRELAHPSPNFEPSLSDASSQCHPRPMNVLALESDQAQLDGLCKREADDLATRKASISSKFQDAKITYKKMWISDSNQLACAIDDWVSETSDQRGVELVYFEENKVGTSSTDDRIPVLFTGLHCCGSLTPAVLRAFRSLTSGALINEDIDTCTSRRWYLEGMALVGCCYNCLDPRGEF